MYICIYIYCRCLSGSQNHLTLSSSPLSLNLAFVYNGTGSCFAFGISVTLAGLADPSQGDLFKVWWAQGC